MAWNQSLTHWTLTFMAWDMSCIKAKNGTSIDVWKKLSMITKKQMPQKLSSTTKKHLTREIVCWLHRIWGIGTKKLLFISLARCITLPSLTSPLSGFQNYTSLPGILCKSFYGILRKGKQFWWIHMKGTFLVRCLGNSQARYNIWPELDGLALLLGRSLKESSSIHQTKWWKIYLGDWKNMKMALTCLSFHHTRQQTLLQNVVKCIKSWSLGYPGQSGWLPDIMIKLDRGSVFRTDTLALA